MTVFHPYVWQHDQWAQLCDVRTGDRLPHAILFGGPEGIGKRRFVEAFASLNLCQLSGRDSLHACGQCRACHLTSAQAHPDFMWISPEENSRTIKIDQIRVLTEFVYKTSQLGGKKIAVIDPAEAMNTNAANALLKVLEEPAQDTFLLLVSDAPGRLLATIRSRCLQVGFPVPQHGSSLDWLVKITGSHETAHDLLRLSSGRPLAALALHEGNALATRTALADVWINLWSRKLDPISVAARWAEYEIDQVLEWLSLWLQDIVRWHASADQAALADAVTCLRLMEGCGGDKIPATSDSIVMLDVISELRRQLASGANPNKQLLLENLAMTVVSKHRHRI